LAVDTKLIVNLTRGNAVCVSEVADRALPRMRGLIGRRGLPAGEGLLLRPAPSIHTAFMRFPIDAVFLDRELHVLEVVERLRPWRMASKRGARAVLELPAGESARRGVRAGDRLELRGRESAIGTMPVAAGDLRDAAVAGRAERAASAANVEMSRGLPMVPSDEGRPLLVARLRPLSVVIISPDHRFATVMALLLSRRNCSVTTTANAGRASELVAREGAGVVIVDADARQADAAIAAVEALMPPIGLLLVAEDARSELMGRQAFSKWGPFDELMPAIERADELRGVRAVQP
jgi:uncharacterized membrane protein (UPF0127 family)